MALTLEEAQTRLSNIDTGDTEALKNLINELSENRGQVMNFHF